MSTELQVLGESPIGSFNPNEHIIQIPNNKTKTDYLPVQWRLVWFRKLCPEGTIDTEEIIVDLDRECEAEVYAWNQDTRRSEKTLKRAPGYARYRAVVTDGRGGRATATKTERGVDFPDFVEKAETGAVGRALAMLGYGTQFAEIEFDESHRIVDAPVDRRQPQEQEKKSYTERKPFVEGSVAKEEQTAQPIHNGDGSVAQPAPGTNAAIMRMVEIAKKRALDLGSDWALLKTSVLGEPIPDGKLIVHHFTKINGELTKREKAATGAN